MTAIVSFTVGFIPNLIFILLMWGYIALAKIHRHMPFPWNQWGVKIDLYGLLYILGYTIEDPGFREFVETIA